MGYLYKEERDDLITNILDEINIVILKNIDRRKLLVNLNSISRLDFLEDIDEVLERQYEIYKEDILADLEHTIDGVIDELEECINNTDHWKMIKSTEYQLDLVNELKKSLFEDRESVQSYNDLLQYISEIGKYFRSNLIKYNYRLHTQMNKRYNNWNILMLSNTNFRYNLSKNLLILN